jgi:integrase
MKRPFLLTKRGEVWYYKLAGEITYHSTGETVKARAQEYAMAMIGELQKRSGPTATLRAYAEPFYQRESCPHLRRLADDGRTVTDRHIHNQRALLKGKVFKDPIADLAVSAIRRSDVLDFRSRLLDKYGARTVNRTIGILKVIFKEGNFREELERDPTLGVGEVHYTKRASGTFTQEELKALFPAEGLGPWKDRLDHACFLLAASTGMRRGEILALRWCNVDTAKSLIHVQEAWKGGEEVGTPKSGKPRTVPYPEQVATALETLREEGIRTAPEDLVICDDDGHRPMGTWWKKRFARAMKKAEIDLKARGLRPHSFRHTLNTILLDSGMDPAKVRAILGWSNLKVQDGYTHWEGEHLREGADTVERILKG